MALRVFLSTGAPHLPLQTAFLQRLEATLRGHGLSPVTLGRGEYDHRNPMQAISDRMKDCQGAVIVGLERRYSPQAIERRGSRDRTVIRNLITATPWNHLEAGMAFQLRLPLLVLRERKVHAEGILDPELSAYFVFSFNLRAEAVEFSTGLKGAIRSWRGAVRASSR